MQTRTGYEVTCSQSQMRNSMQGKRESAGKRSLKIYLVVTRRRLPGPSIRLSFFSLVLFLIHECVQAFCICRIPVIQCHNVL